MKKLVSFTPVFTLLFLLISCGGIGEKKVEELDTSDFKTQTALDMYQISIPKYMKSATGLNVDASMQYQNIFKETYLVVIDEDKADYIDVFKELGEYDDSKSVASNYRKTQIDYFTEGLSITDISEPRQLELNGRDAEQVEFTAKVPEVAYDIYYIITFIEGADNVYMLMEWTLSENKEKYRETFLTMAETFKEI